jgi:type II secretory pathway predicted ATPase ExeA
LPTDAPPQAGTFPYRDYIAARDALATAIKKGPFYAEVIAQSGMGKTCLPRDLAAVLDRHRYNILYLSAPNASILGISRYFAQTCHVTPKRSCLETGKVLADALKSQAAHQVVWLDEADQLCKDTLSQIRVLAECDLDMPQLFSIVFSGLPDFHALLASHTLFPLRRRITVKLQIPGLCRDELDPFLLHRFGSHDEKRIPHGLRDELFERVLATPALLDRVVRHALALAKNEQIADQELREALDVAGL